MRRLSGFAVACLAVLAVPSAVHAQGYGTAVAVGGGDIFVAEPLNEQREGIVFVYRPSGGMWREVAQLRASDAAVGEVLKRIYAGQYGVLKHLQP